MLHNRVGFHRLDARRHVTDGAADLAAPPPEPWSAMPLAYQLACHALDGWHTGRAEIRAEETQHRGEKEPRAHVDEAPITTSAERMDMLQEQHHRASRRRQLRLGTNLANKSRPAGARAGRAPPRAHPARPPAASPSAESRAALADRLVDFSPPQQPEGASSFMILGSDGFADLLERAEFHAASSRGGTPAWCRDHMRAGKPAAMAASRASTRSRRGSARSPQRWGRAAEVDAIKDRLVDRQQEILAPRRQVARARHDPRAARTSRATSPRSRRSRRTCSPGSSPPRRRRCRPDPAGLGALIWPVNGPSSPRFGMRWAA